MVTTRDPELRDRLLVFRNHGISRDPRCSRMRTRAPGIDEQQELGFNYRLSDIHSALGRSQLGKLDALHRRDATRSPRRYREWLGDVDGLASAARRCRGRPPRLSPVRRSACRDGAERGAALYDGLREREILPRSTTCRSTSTPATARPTATSPGSARRRSATTTAACRSPAFPALTDDEQPRSSTRSESCVR